MAGTGSAPEAELTSRERIKRALANGKTGRISKDAANAVMLGVFRCAAYITTLVLVAIIAYVVINGAPHISPDFIFGWPQGVNAEGGIWPTIVSTLYVTALAMLICTPIAVLAAVYLAEYAKQGRLVETIRYAADTLASVPSIVMGLFGYALFVEAMGLGLSMVSRRLRARAAHAADRHAHDGRGHSCRPPLHPLGCVRPGRHEVAGRQQDRPSLRFRPHRHGYRACHRPRHRRDRGRAVHDGPGHQPAHQPARFGPPHDGAPVPARQRRHQHERRLRSAAADAHHPRLQPVRALPRARAASP